MWQQLPDNKYFSLPSLGSSDLKHILRSVAHYFAAKAQPRVETPAQRLGTLTHRAILQPELFSPSVAPKCDRRTKEGKATYEAFLAESEGRDVLSADEMATIDGMRNSANDHPQVSRWLSQGVAESSGEADYLSTRLRCKPDWRRDDLNLILDLKTTDDASPDAFARSVATFKYHLQCAVYMHISRQIWGVEPTYFWIAVEKTPPYTCAVYKPAPHMLAMGQTLMRRAIERWESAQERHDIEEGRLLLEQEIELPRWAWE